MDNSKIALSDVLALIDTLPADERRKAKAAISAKDKAERVGLSDLYESQNARFVDGIRRIVEIANELQGMDHRLTATVYLCAGNGVQARVTRIADATEAEKAPLYLTGDNLDGSEDAPPTNTGKRPYLKGKTKGDTPTPDQAD
jgi:hypothetical protein